MTDYEVTELAINILQDAEVMQEFEDSYWLKVDKEYYDQFTKWSEQ